TDNTNLLTTARALKLMYDYIIGQLDTKSDIGHDHDLDYYLKATVDSFLAGKENVFTKNFAFNKNFGSVAGTVCQGNDNRLSDARPPTTHYHDDRYYTETEITNLLAGKENTFSKNSAFNKNFGTVAGTVCQGNDNRLSDARPPTTHGNSKHSVSFIYELSKNFGTNGYIKFSNGLIFQRGSFSASHTQNVNIYFPLVFPNACRNVQITETPTSGFVPRVVTLNKSYFEYGFDFWSGTGATTAYYFAVGY
ncbi:MAG: gp53-like domain-containing protein, partial [bacterium]